MAGLHHWPADLTPGPEDRRLRNARSLFSDSIIVNEQPMNKPIQLELVGRKIRQLRRQRKFTQVELAKKIGVHQSDLSRMGQGEYKVGLDTLLRILQTFNLNIGDFFDDGSREKGLLENYRVLSPGAQHEVESFIEFKREQEERTQDTSWSETGQGGEEEHGD